MNKNSLLIAATIIGAMVGKSVCDAWRKKQREYDQKLIEATTTPLVDDFINDLQDKTKLQ